MFTNQHAQHQDPEEPPTATMSESLQYQEPRAWRNVKAVVLKHFRSTNILTSHFI